MKGRVDWVKLTIKWWLEFSLFTNWIAKDVLWISKKAKTQGLLFHAKITKEGILKEYRGSKRYLNMPKKLCLFKLNCFSTFFPLLLQLNTLRTVWSTTKHVLCPWVPFRLPACATAKWSFLIWTCTESQNTPNADKTTKNTLSPPSLKNDRHKIGAHK